jgi:hypothetical protein
VADETSTIDPAIAARLAELEAMVAAQHAALETTRVRAERAEAERDRYREAYQALQLEVELARRRLVVAKAERVDTTQLELEFASKLAALDKLAGLVHGDGDDAGDDPPEKRKKRGGGTGRRDLRKAPVPEERLEIPDPEWEGKVERLGFEEHVEVVWRRGGFVRLIVARAKYNTTAPLRTGGSPPTDATARCDVATGIESTTTVTPVPADVTAADITVADGTTTIDITTSGSLVSDSEAGGAIVNSPSADSVVAQSAGNVVATIVTAPMPVRMLPRSYATPSLIAHIATDKFCYGLPLNRQEDRFGWLGVTITRGTMCRWLEEVGATVGATIVEAMRKEALATAFQIATDATGILVQPTPRPDKKRQPCRRAHFFVQIADADSIIFDYSPVETSQVVSELFRGFSGFVQADAKSVFDVLYRPPDRDRVDDERRDRAACREVACWSHGRTGLWEAAFATQEVIAREGLARIMRMFQLERLWKDRTPEERKALRDRHLRPHVIAFFQFADEEFEAVKHQRGMLRSALGYCVRQKEALMRFLEDGRLEMTNNRSERQLRRIATGRAAWLFVGSDDHGQAAANLLTLIASARLHKLDPEVYLRDVLRVLPHWPRDRFLELAPRYWRITRARLDREQLARELGDLTIPEPPLPTAMAASIPPELRPATSLVPAL